MKKILISFYLSLIFLFIFSALVFSKSSDIVMPKWFLNPPKENNIIYATGYAKKKNNQLALVSAANNARAEITRVLEVKVSTMTKQFLEEAKVENTNQASEFTEIVSSSLSSNMLFFSKIAKQELQQLDDSFIAYVLIRLDLADMKNSIDGTLADLSDKYAELGAEDDLYKLAEELSSGIDKQFKKTSIKPDKKEVLEKLTLGSKSKEVELSTGKKPDWTNNFPISNEYFIGVAQGTSMQQAKDSAIITLVTQIEVNIKSEIKDFLREANGVTEEDISQSLKLTVKDNIEDLELVGLWKAGEEEYWAYYRLNIETYKKRQQEKMDNAKRNGLDFLTKSDAEEDPALKFKYAFLGYYLVGKYVSRALKANYKGNDIILVNELTSRMQKTMSEFKINTPTPKIEIDKINPKPFDVKYIITYKGKSVNNFPVKFKNNKGELDISDKAITDSNGSVNCIVNKSIAPDQMQSFVMQLDIESFVEEAAESEEDILIYYNRISKLGIPAKEVLVKVNPPIFNFDLNIENDLNLEAKYKNYVNSMSSNFKNILSKKTNTVFTDKKTKLKLEMIVDGSISQSSRSGQYYTRLVVTINLIDTKTNEEIFTKSTPSKGIKGGSVTADKSVRSALDKYLENYNDKMIKYILEYMQGEKSN